MSGLIATIPKFQFSDAAGKPLANGSLTVYLAGTTTLTNTFQDYQLISANTNPVILDSRGECVLWLESSITYKFVLKNSTGVIQWTEDNLIGAGATSVPREELAASSGAGLVGYIADGVGSIPILISNTLQNMPSVWDKMTSAMRLDSLLDSPLLDHAPAFQSAIDDAVARGIRRIFIPFGRRQRYRFGSKVNIESSGFEVFGDCAPRYNLQDGGYIFGDNGVPTLFDYGNDRADLASNQLMFEGIGFVSTTGFNQIAVTCSQDNNGPHRGVLFRKCCAKGFTDVVALEGPTVLNLGPACVVFDSCVFLGNTNAVRSVNRVFGLRYVGNQSEQGARITGYFDSGITITDNMLEGQSNPINIDSNSPTVNIENNYFEAISGDYIARIKGTNANAVVHIKPNYVSLVTAADYYRLEGVMRVVEQSDLTIPTSRKSTMTMLGLSTSYGSKLKGRFYVGDTTPTMGAGFCDPEFLTKQNPLGLITKQDLGTVALDTPFGQHKTGASITAFPATYFRSNGISYNVGDVVVAFALIQAIDGFSPYMNIYNQVTANIGVSVGQQTLTPYEKGWHLIYSIGIATAAGTQLAFRFGSNGTSVSATNTLNIAAVGGYSIPAANVETFNSQNRYAVELINPLDLTKPLEGSTSYNPPSLADGEGITSTIIVLQAVLGDYSEASFSNDLQGITVTSWVSAANTVSVRFQNESGAVVDLVNGILRARVRKV
jgi:hypothetical protein